ncbi:hypothetical protein [Roseibium sp. RKSG952]|uniref:hypothetical protein n=1 Tax=Roseibium sp. RKSG952 TaxID=2529384 RepID=UPI0012BCCB14|nr:hypothetical protein [Roseibium sp. RKSG952]MTH94734.1 hypothetical protein [Roseibium sp. RKSG952]
MQIATAKTLFQDLDVNLVDSGMSALEISEFLETVRCADFIFDDSLRKWMSKLTICSDNAREDEAPPIIHVGSQSSQRQLFGRNWIRNLGEGIRTPDPVLEKNSAIGYMKALHEGVYYGYASTPVSFDSASIDISFERLIVSLKLPTTPLRRVLAYFGSIQDIEKRLCA